MPVFMLHFESRPNNASADQPPVTADGCALAGSLDEAETMLREEIEAHNQLAGALIAFAELSEAQIATLGEREATLYLKALKNRSQSAVQFNRID